MRSRQNNGDIAKKIPVTLNWIRNMAKSNLQVVVLCGGAGVRFGDSTYPKPMNFVKVNDVLHRYLDLQCAHFNSLVGRTNDLPRSS